MTTPAATLSAPPAPARPRRRLITRRRFFKTLGAACLAGSATYTYGATVEAHNLATTHLTIPIPNLAAELAGTRLVQLSDLHAGRTSLAFLNRAFQAALSLNPDYLLITGDFVDSRLDDLDALCDFLRPIVAQVAVLGITGNHDFAHKFHDPTFITTVCTALSAAGVRMLRNEIHQPMPGPGQLCFAGVEDLWSGLLEPQTLTRAPRDAAVIVLAHNPDSYECLDVFHFDLMLSGHTHGGQVRIPGIGPIFLPVTHRERSQGLFHLSPEHPHRALYVNRGIGHLLQIRLFCPPEITCFTLQPAGATPGTRS